MATIVKPKDEVTGPQFSILPDMLGPQFRQSSTGSAPTDGVSKWNFSGWPSLNRGEHGRQKRIMAPSSRSGTRFLCTFTPCPEPSVDAPLAEGCLSQLV